jgi:hypothetical protein
MWSAQPRRCWRRCWPAWRGSRTGFPRPRPGAPEVAPVGLRAPLEHGRARYEEIGPGLGEGTDRLGVHAPVHHHGDAPPGRHGLERPQLLKHRRDQRLPAEARVHRHQAQEVHLVEEVGNALEPRAGIDGEPRPTTRGADELERAMDMRPGLQMDSEAIGPRIGEDLNMRVHGRHHEVHVHGPRICGRSAAHICAPKVTGGTNARPSRPRGSSPPPPSPSARHVLASLAKSPARMTA